MLSFTTLLTIASIAGSVAAAPVAKRDQPKAWAQGYLEDYDVYHVRYLALSCETQHNTTFFDDCCHPLLSTETLAADRPAYCSPNATASSSAAAYTATADASSTASADSDAEDEYCSATSSVYESIEATATSVIDTTALATAVVTSSSVEASATSTYAEASATSTSSEEASATSTSASASASVVGDADFGHHRSSSAAAPSSTTASPTSTYEAPTTTSSSEAATSTAASSSDAQTGGFATFFYQGGNAGACGTVHSDSDKIIAIDAAGWWSDYESNDSSAYCGKYITITNTDNGKTVTAMVADVCPTCDTNNSLDLSVGAFTAIADESSGEVPITWVWA
ncbi:hypothetical protein P7C73_g171, partial [Tremellales sp. Uapishka_1]